jgi:AraC-like DNA-binding protein
VNAVDTLARMLRERVRGEGRIESALPGLWFFRFSRAKPTAKTVSPTMYLAVAVQGRKRIKVGGLELDYSRRHYLVLRGETPYEAAVVDAAPSEPYLALGLQLPPELVVRTLLEMAEEPAVIAEVGAVPPAFLSPLDDTLADALCRLLACVDSPSERRVLAPLFLREIIFRLLGTEAAKVLRQAVAHAGDRERIGRAISYIEQNAARRLSVNGIAKHVGMSPSRFAHRFKEIASVSPMQFSKHVRLRIARAILLERRDSVGAVADRVGYASAAHFTRDFKRAFGTAPGAYTRAFDRPGAAAAEPVSLG